MADSTTPRGGVCHTPGPLQENLVKNSSAYHTQGWCLPHPWSATGKIGEKFQPLPHLGVPSATPVAKKKKKKKKKGPKPKTLTSATPQPISLHSTRPPFHRRCPLTRPNSRRLPCSSDRPPPPLQTPPPDATLLPPDPISHPLQPATPNPPTTTPATRRQPYRERPHCITDPLAPTAPSPFNSGEHPHPLFTTYQQPDQPQVHPTPHQPDLLPYPPPPFSLNSDYPPTQTAPPISPSLPSPLATTPSPAHHHQPAPRAAVHHHCQFQLERLHGT